MKKNSSILMFTLLIISVFILSACESKEYTLKYTFNVGDVYKQSLEGESKNTGIFNGIEVVTNMVLSNKCNYIITEAKEQQYTIETVYDEQKVSVDVGFGKIIINSNTEDTIATMQNLDPILKALINKPFSVVINEYGKVLSISGFDKLRDALYKSVDTSDANLMNMIQTQFSLLFTDEVVKLDIENGMAFYPLHPVKIGDSWDITLVTKRQHIVKSDLKMTLKSVKNDVAVIEGAGNVYTEIDDYAQGVGDVKIKNNLSGTQKVTIKVDIKTGWVISSTTIQELEGEYETVTSDGESSVMPQKSTNTITVTRE